MVSVFFTFAAYIQVYFRFDFLFNGSKQYDPDLGLYCLQYRLPKNIRRCKSRRQSCGCLSKGLTSHNESFNRNMPVDPNPTYSVSN